MPVAAQDSREAVEFEVGIPAVRGGIVFKTYCTLCHGERGDGGGRWAAAHKQFHLEIPSRRGKRYTRVVRDGGKAVGRSALMPSWRDELSAEQIADVVAYLAVVREPNRRGQVVYLLNCVLCHGIRGDGTGRAAQLSHPTPADLSRGTKNDSYKSDIIRLGGAAMGRSSNMPRWGGQLSQTEIEDLVHYIDTLVIQADTLR